MEDKKIFSTEDTEKTINAEAEASDKIIDNKVQSSLEDLMVDDEDETVLESTPEDTVSYEKSLAEYHELMRRALTHAEDAHNEESNASGKSEEKNSNAECDEVDESEFLISIPKKKPNGHGNGDRFRNQRNEISLIPEEIDELDTDEDFLTDLPLAEQEETDEPDVLLGQETTVTEDGADDFQLSISFEDEKVHVKKVEEDVAEDKYDPESPRIVDYIFEFVELFVFTLAAVIIITSFIFRHSVVEGDSMLSTLENGDHLIISDVFYTPERGDIIVFEDYSTFLKKAVVKRVIGLPGEVVEIKAESSDSYSIYIDGTLYEKYSRKSPDFDSYHTGTWTVGEGEVFVLGDNRYNSTDSRHDGVGTVQIDSILGKVLFRFYPFDKFGNVN